MAPPRDAERRPTARKGGVQTGSQQQTNASEHATFILAPRPPLVKPAHLVYYADVLRAYSLALANGLARQAACADDTAPAAAATVEALQLVEYVDRVQASVHALAAFMKSEAAR